MKSLSTDALNRRSFLSHSLCAAAATLAGPTIFSARAEGVFRVGEAHVDSTPPKGIELAGFHYKVGGNPRYITDIRQKTAVRALVLQKGETQVALISVDIAGVSDTMAVRVQQAVAAKTGIPAVNVRLCATHTHSMPTFAFWRQWGTTPEDYMKTVEAKAVEAVVRAQADCAEGVAHIGSQQAVGGNFNRTSKTWKTDADYSTDSTDDERWLDTMLHVLYFERGAGKHNILWYNFAAHPVCYADGEAGPDWPGLVTQSIQDSLKVTPSYLQGHAGDVNPGDGVGRRGEAEQPANAVVEALNGAMNSLQKIDVDVLRSETTIFQMSLDLENYRNWLATYKADPTACASGNWVDAGFAKEWYEANANRKWAAPKYPASISAVQLGSVGLAFQPSELFSFYGIKARHNSPFDHTLVTGYTDGFIGYVADPKSFNKGDGGQYAAMTVPMILDIPPYTPEAGRELSQGLSALLKSTAV
ncbi:MAG: neutral/alkaline non-lysosomal ceramidase N-terminal domain-containing protein [Candidatus Hydrogenedentes bacterium]|nr:neutral/alkaline non-lysosomal ceramidase N-terminal domain-containing protein [Candidatus Hydrogenedentota bacterium]